MIFAMIQVTCEDTQADLTRKLISGNRFSSGLKLEGYITRIVSGINQAQVYVGVDAVKASGTITLSAHVATDTVTINGVVFTCVASGATGNQYNQGGSDTISATNLAAAINASVTAKVQGYVVASSSGAVVTVTANRPGVLGNMCTLAISAHGSASGATLAGGTDGAQTSTTSYGNSY